MFFTIFVLYCTNSVAQSLWALPEPELEELSYLQSKYDTSIASLKYIINNRDVDSLWYEYDIAIGYLAFYYGQTERNYLLEKLNTQVDPTADIFVQARQWEWYFREQVIRGYLGDHTAIDNLDGVAKYHPNENKRLQAIYLLATVGKLDYYEYTENKYLNDPSNKDIAESCLASYGKDIKYTEKISRLLENSIKNSNDPSTQLMPALSLAQFNKSLATTILNDYFENTTGQLRREYFDILNVIDKNGQPERSIYALKYEQDEYHNNEIKTIIDLMNELFDDKYTKIKNMIDNGIIDFHSLWLATSYLLI